MNYLPPVLWEKEPPPPAYSLGAVLRIFEKLLTGIDDSIPIQHGDHTHDSLEEMIAQLPRLYNPRETPPAFVDWLASWVGLEFPPIWDNYQRRKITSQIVQIYRKRGLKSGLDQYLELYTVAAKRPRIAVDTGSKILFTQPQANRFVPIYTLISQGPAIHNGTAAYEGLIAPRCMTLAPDGSLILGDDGTPVGFTPIIRKGIWRIPPPGRYDYGGAPPKPQRLGPPTLNLTLPMAVVTDNSAPWQLYVLDNVLPGAATALYQLASPNFSAANALATKTALGTIWPVAMVLDNNGHLLILDRGIPVPSGNAATPKIIDVQIQPLTITSRNLTQVLEPLSLLVQPNGDLIIGDAREQNSATPADLVRVDRSNAALWAETRLLSAVPAGQNPLLAPTAVVRADANHLYVLDLGLKAYATALDPALSADPFRREAAEPAAVYQVDLSAAPPLVTRTTETAQLVFPSGMVLDQGTLYISDRGEYSDPILGGSLLRAWRAMPFEFGVIIYFSEQRPTTQQERRQIIQNIHDIISQEMPAHTIFTMAYTA